MTWLRSRPGPTGWWVVGITVLAAVLWLQRVGSNPLFIDEAASWSVASRPGFGSWWHDLLHQEVAPPPFYLGLRVIVDTLGLNGHAAMRVPVAATTLPCVPLAALITRRCGGSGRAVVLTALLVALSPLMLMYAQQVRAYGPAATATLGAVLLLLRAADRDWEPRASLVAGVAVGIAPFVHYVSWLPLAPVLAWAALSAPRRARSRLLLGAAPLWLASAAVAVVQYRNVGAGMDDQTALSGDDFRRVLAGAWDGRYADDTALSLLGAVGLVVLALAAVGLRGRPRLIAMAGLTGPVAIVVISTIGPDIVTTRYLVPAAPLALVAIALALDRFELRVKSVASVGAIVLLAVATMGVARTLTPRTGDYPDFERVVGYTVPSLTPNAVIASESFFVGTWMADYIGAQSGVPGIGSAWGLGQLGPKVCARRPVVQLADPAALPQTRSFWGLAGYRIREMPTPSPEYVLIVAKPEAFSPTACDGIRREP